MVRNLYLVVVSVSVAVAVIMMSSAWTIWQQAIVPLMQALSGIR